MKFTFAPEAKPLAGYTIKRAIERGGFGEVYYALSDSGKEVALKLLQRNQEIELRGVSQCLNLKHPNLVTIFDIRTDAEGDQWVVMEYIAGDSLERELEQNPRGLCLPEVEAWLNGTAAGVAFLHDRGLMHRDLKPANLFRENGIVRVGDVGLSKFIASSRRDAQTQNVGTVHYMAPEVARGQYGVELDVYSLGVILFEMLTGRPPFDGESAGEILMKHLTEPPDLATITPELRPVLARVLEKDPARRTPGPRQLALEFQQALRGVQSFSCGARPAPSSQILETQIPSPAANSTAINENGRRGATFAQAPVAEPPVQRLLPPVAQPPVTRPPPPLRGRRLFTPDTRRTAPLRGRLSELATSMTWASFWSIAATVVAGGVAPSWGSPLNVLQDPAWFGFFTFTTVLAAWAILVHTKFCEGAGSCGPSHRLVLTLMGCGVGAAAYWLKETLCINWPPSSEALLSNSLAEFGRWRMARTIYQPGAAGFTLFFAALFALRNWRGQADAFRLRPFRLGAIVFTACVACVIPFAVPFPRPLAIMLAAAISGVVQLAAIFTSPSARIDLVEQQSPNC